MGIQKNRLTMYTRILFFVGLIIKIFASFTILPELFVDYFNPFLNYFISSDFQNPYAYFHGLDQSQFFPYPAFLLYYLSFFKLAFGWLLPQSLAWNYFVLHIPLLICDFAIFSIFRKWTDGRRDFAIVMFYWLSPVLFFISYIHGQLDVIPIALVFVSLYFLFKEKLNSSAIFLGLALAAKTNIFVVFVFLYVYLQKKYKPFEIVKYFSFVILVFIGVNFNYLTNPQFLEMVFLNKEQFKIFGTSIAFGNSQLYLVPVAICLLFVHGLLLKTCSKDVLIMLLGFAFSIVLFFVPPMQGWYFWLIPFLTYFYINEKGRRSSVFFCLQICYLLYFGIKALMGSGVEVDIFPQLLNLVFTILQTVLLLNCYLIYKKGLDTHYRQKLTASPFLLGIGGNSGAGKSLISDALVRLFLPTNSMVLRGDDMHKWQRADDNWQRFTHLDPKANFLHEENYFLRQIKLGKKVFRRSYNHETGTFTEPSPVKAKGLTIFEGLHPFYFPSQTELFDLKIFIKPSWELLCHWKIVRDISKRGYSKEKVLSNIRRREKDSFKYIDSQASKADILVEYVPVKPIENIGCSKENVELCYKVSVLNSLYIEPIIDELNLEKNLFVEHDYSEEKYQTVTIRGDIAEESIYKVGLNLREELEVLGITEPKWPAGLFGVLTLLLVYCIFEKSKYEKQF